MAKWRKPDETLVRLLDETISGLEFDQPVDYRPMFGCPAYFTGGNMFAGVWQETVMLRLPEDERAAVTAAGGGPFEPMEGRPMKEYVALPASMVADPAEAAGWVRRAAAYAASLPPKQKKPRKKKA
ncbi:MAG TPA: TfoX/Sxy family protein [Thermoleophilia bacterium]|nr:TfoX/Sxy family protein [Thermoleophilia bacterium]